MMGLAPALGRQNAHDIVYDACRTAASEGKPLYDVLRATPELAGKLSDEDLRRLTDPATYLGEAPRTIDRFLASRRRPEDRRVGKEWVSNGRACGAPDN